MSDQKTAPKAGDVLLVRVRPGNLNGVRSRAGLVFSDGADTVVTVGDNVSVEGARLILGDDGLIVSRPPPPAPRSTAPKSTGGDR